jgi:hypothetical protein
MCVDCVLASPRIAQVDPGDEPLSKVVLSQWGPARRPKPALMDSVAWSSRQLGWRLDLLRDDEDVAR